MKVLKKIKEKIMAMSNGGYAFGWSDPNQTLLGSAGQGNSLLGNAAQQSTLAMRQSQLQMQMAQQQAQLAQQGYNNMFGGGSGSFQQAIPKTLSAFNLNANSLYTFDELNDEGSVYNMPLQTAIDLAINTFGSGWFRDESTVKTLEENTDFWIKVLSKIGKAGRLKCETCRDFDTDTIKTAWKILDTDHAD